MIVLGYVGDHKDDTIAVRLGWFLTRLAQRGIFKKVTHVEGYYGKDEEGNAFICSSSLRDGGVRCKSVKLQPHNWIAVDVPSWDKDDSLRFIWDKIGAKYDWWGAVSTGLLVFGSNIKRWFCNEILGASVNVVSPEIFGPAQFMALALSMPGAKIVNVENL